MRLERFCSKDPYQVAFRGVKHLNGFKYATNGQILIKVASDYDAALEGALIGTDGAVITGARNLCYDSVLSVKLEEYNVIPGLTKLNMSAIRSYIKSQGKKESKMYIALNGMCCKVKNFALMLATAKEYKSEVLIKDQHLYTYADGMQCIMMFSHKESHVNPECVVDINQFKN